MFRTSDTVLFVVMVAAAAFTYKTKHDAEDQYREVRKLQTAIAYQQDTISVLKADWSLLTQPARLQRLVEHYQQQVGLQPGDPRQIVNLSEIPEKQLGVEDLIADAEPKAKGKTKDAIKDVIKTGSVKP